MSTQSQFFLKLSQNYITLLDDDEYYDVTVEVGEDPNVKIFRAHMNILSCRSPYLRRLLSSNKKNNNDGSLTHIKLPNTILPETFQIILKYIYGGILPLDGRETSEILNILVVADVLCLQELVDYLQKYLIEDKSVEWIKENFGLILQFSSQYNNSLELQQFCANFIAKSPEEVFKSFDFTLLPEKSLISIIKKDDLQMEEVEVWEHVLKWGLAQNPTLIPDPKSWSKDDFKTMKKTLQNCLPLIRFFCLSSEEFSQRVRPYKKLLKDQLYEDLLDYYLDSVNSTISTDNIPLSLPRKVDSKIVDLNIVSIISRHIDKIDTSDDFEELYLPYKFELLLRGSRDGFTPKKFHELCDNKPNTVTFIKVKETDEILGGYNPIIWKSPDKIEYGKTKDSFIFSFKNKNNTIISNVKNSDCALLYNYRAGPYFGHDLVIYTPQTATVQELKEESHALAWKEFMNFYDGDLNYADLDGGDISEYSISNGSIDTDFEKLFCKRSDYEKMIRDTGVFSMEDYEVFQIVKK